MKFLVPGHTGFKGSWLSLMLKMMGHDVSGISLNSAEGSLYDNFEASSIFTNDHFGDVCSVAQLSEFVAQVEPEIVVHLAAQALVRESYRDPLNTFETNVTGTHNLLRAITSQETPPLTLVITTDKVYFNDGRKSGYVESDELGGKDPYSSSKAVADVLVQSWQTMNPSLRLGVARAGNVIGGGDVSKERLVPDLIRSILKNKTPRLRNPFSVRPWQHVLDCLSGYLMLIEYMGAHTGSVGAWNFGPMSKDVRSVADVATKIFEIWETDLSWQPDSQAEMPEADFLLLNSDKARSHLKWKDQLNFDEALEWTVNWHRRVQAGVSVRTAMEEDIAKFLDL